MESAKLPPSDIVEDCLSTVMRNDMEVQLQFNWWRQELPHLVPHKPHTKLPLSTPLLTVGRLMQGLALNDLLYMES